MANQLDALAVPDVGDECVAPGKPAIQLLGRKNSVVDFAAEGFFGLADCGGELRLVRPAEDQKSMSLAASASFFANDPKSHADSIPGIAWSARLRVGSMPSEPCSKAKTGLR